MNDLLPTPRGMAISLNGFNSYVNELAGAFSFEGRVLDCFPRYEGSRLASQAGSRLASRVVQVSRLALSAVY